MVERVGTVGQITGVPSKPFYGVCVTAISWEFKYTIKLNICMYGFNLGFFSVKVWLPQDFDRELTPLSQARF